MKTLFFIASIAVLLSGNGQNKVTLEHLAREMKQVLDTSHSAQFTLEKLERFGNEMKYGKSKITYDFRSHKTFITTLSPQEDVEVTYQPMVNKDEATVHINFFPYLTVDLDIHGAILLRDQHHPVSHVNFHYFAELLGYYFRQTHLQKNIQIQEIKHPKHGPVWKVDLESSAFTTRFHAPKRTVRFIDWVDGKFLNPFYVQELNPNFDYDDSLTIENSINLPNSYAQRAEILLSKEFSLPLSVKFWNGNSLYEHYQFEGLRIW